MTRSVYVTGIDRGDGRQVVELGVMELLTRQVDRVGVFRPLVHDGPDRLFELLRARYRLAQDPASVYGMDYHEASALQAEKGTDELVSQLVDRFHAVARAYDVVLVLGTDFAATQLPDELALNARLANEFGASVLPVVGGKNQTAESVRAETRNAHRAYDSLGCDVLAMVTNRVAPADRDEIHERLAARLPVPCYVLPDEPALAAPTVAQITHALGGKVLLGGRARSAFDLSLEPDKVRERYGKHLWCQQALLARRMVQQTYGGSRARVRWRNGRGAVDIRGSRAHVQAIHGAGILDDTERDALLAGLDADNGHAHPTMNTQVHE